MRANTERPHRRADELLRDLSAEQREAVTAPGGPLLVVAGPGSGKTGLVGEEAGRAIEVGTFHAVCHRQVRAHARRVGRSGAFSIWDAQDTRRAVGQAVKEVGGEGVEPPEAQRVISLAKARLDHDLLSDGAETGGDGQGAALTAVWRRYEQLLARSAALDFDDLIGRAVGLLRDHPDVLAAAESKLDAAEAIGPDRDLWPARDGCGDPLSRSG